MADYNKWPKQDLIRRVIELEEELRCRQPDALSHPAALAPSEPTAAAAATTTATNPPQGGSDPDIPAKQKQKKGPKAPDPSKYATRFIALKLAYIGKNYNGFEYQCAGQLSTIEEELWNALVKSCLIFPDPERPNEVDWTVCEYSKCGRTDRGVSAFGQVVALRVRSNKPARRKSAKDQTAAAGGERGPSAESAVQDDKDAVMHEGEETAPEEDDDIPLPVDQEIQYSRVLNRILPPDIKVYAWCPNPPPDFSARFSCRERQYRYFFTQPAFAPLPNFLEKNGDTTAAATTTKPKDGWLDIEAMRRAAKMFEGLHDFRNFCKVDPSKQITNFMRRIYEADIVEVDDLASSIPYLAGPQYRNPTAAAGGRHPKVYYFHVRGSAFLWHQIRCMVAILFLVSQGLEPPEVVTRLLDAAANPRRPNYVLADDAPLVLWDCIFGRENDDGAADELDWLYVGAEGDSPLNLHGSSSGVATDLWAYWRERKMDEILANRLLDWVSLKTNIDRMPMWDIKKGSAEAKFMNNNSTRVFEGANGPRLVGKYVPVLQKVLLASPDEQNDRWAQKKGFKDAEEMRARGNWREVIKVEQTRMDTED